MVMAKERAMETEMPGLELRAFEPMTYAQLAEVRSKAPKDRERLKKTIFHFSFDICHLSFETIDPRK